ncbi:MAG: ABC transporter permease subunit [Spirochaetales bacterium]|nr:ABC transporter permease subunit [Spirochaetales bacterium]
MFERILTITKKELNGFYNSPVAYIITGLFLVFMSVWLFFIQRFIDRNAADLLIFFSVIPFVFMFVIPALTMRSWAEEKKMRTDEILLTLPFREVELVIGKFIAPFILLTAMLVLTLPIPLALSALGDFEWGQIIGQYIGVVFFGAACISLGLFISALSTNQIISFILSTVSLFFIIIVTDFIQQAIPVPAIAGFVGWFSFRTHYETLSNGLIDTQDLLFYIIMSVFFLYLNTRTLIFKKWS